MSFAKALAVVEEEARATLRGLCRPGDIIFCVLRGVSRSGASRRVDFFIWKEDRPICISRDVADLLGMRVSRDGGIYINTPGVGAVGTIIQSLSSALHGESDSDVFVALRSVGYSEEKARDHVRAKLFTPGNTLKSAWI